MYYSSYVLCMCLNVMHNVVKVGNVSNSNSLKHGYFYKFGRYLLYFAHYICYIPNVCVKQHSVFICC